MRHTHTYTPSKFGTELLFQICLTLKNFRNVCVFVWEQVNMCEWVCLVVESFHSFNVSEWQNCAKFWALRMKNGSFLVKATVTATNTTCDNVNEMETSREREREHRSLCNVFEPIKIITFKLFPPKKFIVVIQLFLYESFVQPVPYIPERERERAIAKTVKDRLCL